MHTIISLDSVSWATSISRTRLTSDAGFGLHGIVDVDAVSDLQDILSVTRQLQVPVIPQRELRRLEHIGEGVNFSVIKHLWGDKIVALKYVKKLGPNEDKDVFRRRLRSTLRELMVMHHKPLAAHPNVVKLLGCGWQLTEGRPAPFIAVELGSLGTLRHFLRSKKPLDLQKKLLVAGDVAAGLMALHQAGIIHGDLKLDNVVCFQTWSRQGACQAKLCDFSHSIAISGAPKNVHYYGTLRYLPPEALNQHQRPIAASDVHKCDIWAFGLALWEILIDGEIYMKPNWLHDPLYARPTSAEQSCVGSWVCVSATDSHGGVSSVNSVRDQSQLDSMFGEFDFTHLSALACKAVDSVTSGTATPSGFARAYLRPLMKRTLEPDPQNRFSDIVRWPIITNWQAASRYTALESKLAFHTLKSHLSFDMFLPDRQNDIAWVTQTHIHDDIEKVISGDQQGPFLSELSIQLALCKAFGFGCDIDLQQSGRLLERSLQYDTVFANFVGQVLVTRLTGTVETQHRLFADRLAAALALNWDINCQSEIALRAKTSIPSDPCHEKIITEDMRLGYFPSLQKLLMKAVSRSQNSIKTVLSRYLICLGKEDAELSWLELAVLRNDRSFVASHWRSLSVAKQSGISESSESSLLLLACGRGQAAMVRQLLDLGAHPATMISGNGNLLHYLICLKDQAVEILHEAMQMHPLLKDQIDVPCDKVLTAHAQWPLEITGSPLAIAVMSGHAALVEALLVYGACFWSPAFISTQQNQESIWTPMHLAIKYNFSDIVELFMQRPGAHSFHQRYSGDLLLGSALSFLTAVERYGIHGSASDTALNKTVGLIPNESLSASDGKGLTPILQAIDFENYEVVSALLRHLPALAIQKVSNPADAQEFTLPLHFACQIGARKDVNYVLRIPKLIVETCPEALHQRDSFGRSALHLAVTSEYAVVADWLLNLGLDVDGCDHLDRTALMLCQSAKASNHLIERGADIALKDQTGMTAAHFAVSCDNHEVLKTLIRHGLNVDLAIPESGRTLLHEATIAASLECIQVLCQTGASVNVKDSQGCTPLHLAMATTPEIVRLLVDRGSDLVSEDNSGRTPIRIAIDRFSNVTSRLSEGQKMFESLIQPLSGLLAIEERNTLLLAQVLSTVAEHGTAESVTTFFRCLNRKGLITVNTTWQGRRPLHAAAATTNLGSARALCRLGCVEVNSVDHKGRTALMILSTSTSMGYNLPDFFELLIGQGAYLDAQNSKGESAWSLALHYNNFKMLIHLLSNAGSRSCASIIEKHPLRQDHLIAAVDARCKRLVEVFSCWVQIHDVPTTYSPDLMSLLANALMCQESWKPIGKRLSHVCSCRSNLLRATLRGDRVPLEVGHYFNETDDDFSTMSGDLKRLLSAVRAERRSEQRQVEQRLLHETPQEETPEEETTQGETPQGETTQGETT